MSVRHPTAIIEAGGAIVPTELDVTLTTQQQSDSFAAHFPMRAPGVDVAYFAGATEIPVTALISGVRVFTGKADSVDCDFTRGVIHLSGRDKSASLNEKKTIESFRNKTRVDVVKEIASRHGLKLDLDAGSDKAGKQYQIDFAEVADHFSDWSLVQKLADLEGKVAYVRDGTLYLKDPNDSTGTAYDIWYVPPTHASHAAGNWVDLRFRRNMSLAKGAKVKVKSWHSKAKKTIEAERVDREGGKSFQLRHSQLTQGQADKVADKKLAEAVRHEIACTADVPGDPRVNPRGKITVRGTGTAFDQSYFIDSIHHRIAQGQGHRMTIQARNKKGGK